MLLFLYVITCFISLKYGEDESLVRKLELIIKYIKQVVMHKFLIMILCLYEHKL
jgi:hypothetical protein